MTDETTPLTSTLPHGPVYAFPGGVSPRSRRHKMQQYQCCICITFIGILVLALLITLLYGNAWTQSPVFLLQESTVPTIILSAIDPTTPIPDEPTQEWALHKKSLPRMDNEAAVGVGLKALGDRELLEESSQMTPVNSAAFRHYRSLNTNPEARKLARRGYVENHATLRIAQLYNYTKPAGERSNIGSGPSILIPTHAPLDACDYNARFRLADGRCNSRLEGGMRGAALTSYRRMVAPDYEDGISKPRVSHSGAALPTARDVSLRIHRAAYETDSNFTVMLAVFGQFLDHDITATSLTTSQEGESIDCCQKPVTAEANAHPECFAVPIAADDPYYRRFNVSCMNFVRSAPAPTGHFGPRQQLNQATAFIDGSVVYGSSVQRQTQLRSHVNGTLRMYATADGRQLLPISTNADDGCNREQMSRAGKYCFESGDDRANENLLLTSMHLLFARQHNFLAQGLQQLQNPRWDDERLFQEARKILGAQLAHITYNEFLPILLGKTLATQKGLLSDVDEAQTSDTYERDVDPAIANCFAAAAFRFAHTLLPGLFNMTRDRHSPASMELHKMLFNPFSLWSQQGVDYAIMAAANTPVMRVDRFFSLEVTQKLFEGTAGDKLPICGLDLVSLNIQRGRDHGLPAYPVFRRHCGLQPVDTWEDMAQAVEPSSLQSIREIYATPYDVDVYTGALSEPPLEGAIFGPLLTCMVSDQFLRLKRGDAHWYERKFGPQRFTKDQLREIYKTTLAGIICRNSDAITQAPKYVMEQRRDGANPLLDCPDIMAFNFTTWQQPQHPVRLHSSPISQSGSRVHIMQKSLPPTPPPNGGKANETKGQ